jgi:hypothetical protein
VNKVKSALIIGTEVATNQFESGASIRLASIRDLIAANGFEVSTTSKRNSGYFLKSDWDLIVLVSYSTSSLLRLARKRAKFLWFDPTDSWTLTRLSLISIGELRQVFALTRDLYWIWTSPLADLITFVSERDALKEQIWWRGRSNPLILSIHGLDRNVKESAGVRFVFIGDGRYGPNKQAIKFLSKCTDFLPNEFSIHLIGRDLRSKNKRFISHGYLNDREVYFRGDIHLAPIQHGAGLKLKAAVPLWNGLRVISTSEGSNGIRESNKLLVANSPRYFAECMVRLFHEEFINMDFKPRERIYVKDDVLEIQQWLKSIG